MKDILKEKNDLIAEQQVLLDQCLTAFELLEFPLTPQTIVFVETLRDALREFCSQE
jgi:hypothetical protein